MSSVYNVIKRPVITEKGLTLKENDRTLCFEVAESASKQQIQEAVEQLFKVKVQAVRTMVVPGKMRLSSAERPASPQFPVLFAKSRQMNAWENEPLNRTGAPFQILVNRATHPNRADEVS